MSQIHIAIVIPDFDQRVGGREAWVVGFATRLRDEGFRVSVICERAAGQGPDVEIVRYGWSRFPGRRARAVAAALERVGADAVYDVGIGFASDVLHLHTGSEIASEQVSVAAGPWPTRLRVALVPSTRLRWVLATRLEATQVARARNVVAVSALVAAQLERRHGPLGERLAVVPNGIDLTRYARPPADNSYRARFGSDGSLVLLAVGHNHFLKGFDVAVEAVGLLHAAGHRVRLVVAGGPAHGALARLVENKGLAHRGRSDTITLLGAVDDMPALYAACDILVHPTRWDACGLVILEAMAAGRAVIASSMAGAAERLVPGTTGLILEAVGDPHELARHILTLSDAAVRHRMGSAAARAAADFDIRRNHDAIIALLVAAAEVNRHAHR